MRGEGDNEDICVRSGRNKERSNSRWKDGVKIILSDWSLNRQEGERHA